MAYSTCSSLRQPSIFLFFFHYYFSFRPVEIYLYFVVYTREFGKRPLLKIFSLKKCAKYETCAKCAEYETCAICTGLICCKFFETIFFLKIRDKRIFEYFHFFLFFFFLGGGGGLGGWGWGCGGGDI